MNHILDTDEWPRPHDGIVIVNCDKAVPFSMARPFRCVGEDVCKRCLERHHHIGETSKLNFVVPDA